MNTQVAEKTTDGDVVGKAVARSVARSDAKRKPRKAAGRTPPAKGKAGKTAKTSKKDQLVALLSKPGGARISMLVERLGWQAHTVRAALSGLRKQGFEITTPKSAKTGETVYAIMARPAGERAASDGAVS